MAPWLVLAALSGAQPMAAVPLVLGDEAGITPSQLYDAAFEATRQRLGLRLLTREEVFVASREGLAVRLRDCGAAVSCLASRLRTFDANLGLLIVLNADLDPPLITLKLLDTDRRRLVDERTVELTRNAASELNKLSEAIGRLLGAAGFEPSARVIVQLNPPHAELSWADGTEATKSNVYTLEPGSYEISAQAADHQSVTERFTVLAGEERTVAVTLEEKQGILRSPIFWVVTGAAILGAGAAAAAVVLDNRGHEACVARFGESCD